MKTNIVAILGLLLLLPGITAAKSVEFQNVNSQAEWEQVLQQAAQSEKLVFIDFYTDWCGWCKHMDKTTFKEDHVVNFMAEQFIAVKMDGDADFGGMMGQKYGVDAYPYYVIANDQAVKVGSQAGYIDAESFEGIMAPIVANAGTVGALMSTPVEEMSESQLQQMALFHFNQDNTEEADAVAQQFFDDNQVEYVEKIVSPEFLSAFMSLLPWEKQAGVLKRLNGDNYMNEDQYLTVLVRNLEAAVNGRDRSLLDSAMESLIPLVKSDRDEQAQIRTTCNMIYQEHLEDWAGYSNTVKAAYDDGVYGFEDLIDPLFTLLNYGEEEEVLKTALDITSDMVQGDSGWVESYMHAYALHKNGQDKSAMKEAKRCLKLCKQAGEDTSSAEELIEMLEAESN